MSDKKQESGGGGTHLLGVAFRAGLGACEKMQRTAIEIPLDILAKAGFDEEKVTSIREQAGQKIHEMYELIDSAATKTGLVDDKSKE
ncbi:MAG: hypothetical protein QNJ73_01110 [Gammaproteobacteria bacterium]|nr:hypothetical protein [Gammaproteobacteria bacterium]